MSNFKPFGESVETQLKSMIALDKSLGNLFIADVTGEELWDKYLSSFPEGSNPIYLENTVHDCGACRNFVKNLGAVIYVNGDAHHTIWGGSVGGDIDEDHAVVAKAMDEFVKSKGIKSQFLVTEGAYGSGRTYIFDHFYARIPRSYQMKNRREIGSKFEDVQVTKRSIVEITDDSVGVVLELINQNSIYRGQEFKPTVEALLELKSTYNKISGESNRDLWLWTVAKTSTRIRNTAIGTLLTDISDGVAVEKAVASFESKVAPANYKRPVPIVTEKMKKAAEETANKLGIHNSLYRKHAKRSDINVSDVLFADNRVKPKMLGGIFDNITPNKTKKAVVAGKAAKVTLEKFLKDVLPNAESVDLLVENSMVSNFVSLVAPVFTDSNPIMKWGNEFSWSYDGEVTDSIAQRVKRAGGNIDADVRVSLSWHNSDDLDLSIIHLGDKVSWGKPRNFGGHLDVDTNGIGASNSVDPVENITWAGKGSMPKGNFDIIVHQYSKNNYSNLGFEVEVEILGETYTYESSISPQRDERILIGRIENDGAGNITVVGDKLKLGSISQEKWGVSTGEWAAVDMVMKSPNHWEDGRGVGNEHVFFMLQECKNPDPVRGFYNEFLREELKEHRKVFELLASQTRVEYSDEQLSGVGFSTTQKKEITLRVKGATNRTIKVVI